MIVIRVNIHFTANPLHRLWSPRPAPTLTGSTLERAASLVNFQRIRKHKRTWWTMWLLKRNESDAELSERVNKWLAANGVEA